MANINTNEVAVIGAGPVGLFAIFECGIMGISSHVFDNLDYIGGQCNALYAQKPIYDIPASQNNGSGFNRKFKTANRKIHPKLSFTGKKVEKITKESNLFKIERENEKPIFVNAIIIAAGRGFLI